MQARRGTAAALSCLLALLLLAAVHPAGPAKHAVRGVALLAPAASEAPQSWRAAADDAVPTAASGGAVPAYRVTSPQLARQLAARAVRALPSRGPPAPALGQP
jgi:hypothetical protein